jgi:hypothetical protein
MYTIDMASVGMIYMQRFMKIDTDIQAMVRFMSQKSERLQC